MHPEILRQLGSQRGSEMRARAQQIKLARAASRALRAARRADGTPDEFAVSAIPDYVDGSFLAEPTEDRPGRIPAGRHAA